MCENHYKSGEQVEEFYALNGKQFEFGDKDAMFRFASHIGLDVAAKELADEVDVNQRAGYALRYACLYGHEKVVRTLLEKKGANVHEAQDCAIVWAAEYGHLKVVKMLLEAGAHRTPEAISIARENGHEEVVEILTGPKNKE